MKKLRGVEKRLRSVEPPLRRMVRAAIKAQHKAARREANKAGFKLVTETVAQLIRDAGGPAYAPVASVESYQIPPEHHGALLTAMPQPIVARIQSPPPEYAGLNLRTVVMLAVEEWRELQKGKANDPS